MTALEVFVPTPEQAAVIDHDDGALLVIAGAGTGKTETVARRIERLVATGRARPDELLALTFTNKAAAELAARVRARLGADADVTVSTYHGFAGQLVSDYALELDLPPHPTLINRGQAWQLCLAAYDEYRFEERSSYMPSVVISAALALVARLDDFLVDLDAVRADCSATLAAKATRQHIHRTARGRQELCQVIEAYTRAKRVRGLLDFGDQIRAAVRLVTEWPDIAASLRAQHPTALLDEYQDTNYAQRVLLTAIYPPGSAVTAVGDDLQSIYGFRGAHVRNIVEFADHFAPATRRELTINRRSGPAIVALANRIHAEIDGALEKDLRANDGAAAASVECFCAASDAEEARQIAADIAESVPAGRTGWSERAVLCRTRGLIPGIVAALEARKVPVEVVGIGGLLERPEIVDLLAWLELLADRTRNVALVRLLQGSPTRLGWRDLAALARHFPQHEDASGDRVPLVLADAVQRRAEIDALSHAARLRLDDFESTWAELARAAERLPVAELCDEIARRTGMWAEADHKARENLLRFGDLAQRYAPVDGVHGLAGFVDYVAMVAESEEELGEAAIGDRDAVRVMTVHQAKGLEFDQVWVPGLGKSKFPGVSRGGDNPERSAEALPWWVRENTERLPHWSEVSSGAAMDELVRARNRTEEWRLFYVATTRARHRLVLSAAQWYAGPVTPAGPSELYEFVAGQSDLVHERYRHEPADRDPAIVAMEQRRQDHERALPIAAPDKEHALTLFDVAPAPAAPRRLAPLGLSVTSLVSFARCPRQFHWSVVRPLPRRVSPAAALGTLVHRWIETRHGPQGVLLDDAAAAVGSVHGATGTRGDLVRGLQASFASSPWAEVAPMSAEAPFELIVGAHLVRGRVDAVYKRPDGTLDIVDFKTGRPPVEGDPGGDTQLRIYALAAVDAWGESPDAVTTSYVYLKADGSPAETVTVPVDAGTVAATRAWLAEAAARIDTADSTTVPGLWCTRCDFAAYCEARF